MTSLIAIFFFIFKMSFLRLLTSQPALETYLERRNSCVSLSVLHFGAAITRRSNVKGGTVILVYFFFGNFKIFSKFFYCTTFDKNVFLMGKFQNIHESRSPRGISLAHIIYENFCCIITSKVMNEKRRPSKYIISKHFYIKVCCIHKVS